MSADGAVLSTMCVHMMVAPNQYVCVMANMSISSDVINANAGCCCVCTAAGALGCS